MNIAVLNIASNVGKTVIAKHLLQPRLGLDYLLVGALGDDGHMTKSDKKLSADNYSDIQDLVIANQHIIVDVSSTHIEQFLQQMAIYEGSYEDYAYFIIPTCDDFETLVETERTLWHLRQIGVDTNRIRLIFNKALSVSPVLLNTQFGALIELAKRYHIQSPKTALMCNEVFPFLRRYHLSLLQLLDEPITKNNLPHESHAHISQAKKMQELANQAEANMDDLFADLKLEVTESDMVVETRNSLMATTKID